MLMRSGGRGDGIVRPAHRKAAVAQLSYARGGSARLRARPRFIIAAVCGAALFLVIWLPWARSFQYEVVLSDEYDDTRAGLILDAISSQTRWGIVPKVHILWFPKKEIQQRLEAALPQYASVSVERIGLRRAEIRGVLRVPFAQWCRAQDELDDAMAEPHVFTTPLPVKDCPAVVGAQEGVVYTPRHGAPKDSLPQLLWVVAFEQEPPAALDSAEFASLRALVRWLDAQGVEIQRIESTPRWVSLRLALGASLFLPKQGSLEEIPAYLQALVREGVVGAGEHPTASTELAAALQTVRYIDFRDFPRVYVGKE